VLTLDDIKVYTKDLPEFNILLEGQEQSSDALINLAMKLALSTYNGFPPVSTYFLENFPNDAILLDGTLYHLANSEAERQLRNQINFSAQGVQSSVDDKFQQYQSLAAYYRASFEQKTTQLKQYMNTEDAWGEGFSPYIAINDFNFRN